jgi:NAD(P)-dependent dehydrogenase (short-subunit alcohol dehydrogenase family)
MPHFRQTKDHRSSAHGRWSHPPVLAVDVRGVPAAAGGREALGLDRPFGTGDEDLLNRRIRRHPTLAACAASGGVSISRSAPSPMEWAQDGIRVNAVAPG